MVMVCWCDDDDNDRISNLFHYSMVTRSIDSSVGGLVVGMMNGSGTSGSGFLGIVKTTGIDQTNRKVHNFRNSPIIFVKLRIGVSIDCSSFNSRRCGTISGCMICSIDCMMG